MHDLAIARWRAGDRAGCLKIREPLREAGAKTDEEISQDHLPEEAKLLLPVVRAAGTNLKLCQG
ncbi:MAG: hypothetical protein ABWZ88_11695 [Variovorax sp.]